MKSQSSGENGVAENISFNGAIPETWGLHYVRLLQLREKIAEDAQELLKESSEPVTTSNMQIADAASDSFDREMALSLLSLEQDAIAEIDAALNRIREGTYGVCEITGKLIPGQRLEAIPWARCTAAAQARLEAEGATSHAHLNAPESARGTHNGR